MSNRYVKTVRDTVRVRRRVYNAAKDIHEYVYVNSTLLVKYTHTGNVAHCSIE